MVAEQSKGTKKLAIRREGQSSWRTKCGTAVYAVISRSRRPSHSVYGLVGQSAIRTTTEVRADSWQRSRKILQVPNPTRATQRSWVERRDRRDKKQLQVRQIRMESVNPQCLSLFPRSSPRRYLYRLKLTSVPRAEPKQSTQRGRTQRLGTTRKW